MKEGKKTDTTEIQKNHETTICQQTGQPRRNGQVSRSIQPAKSEPRRN